MDEVLVTASSIAALLFLIWIALKNTVRGLPARGILAVVSIVTLALEPIRTSVALGQINLVLAALVAAGCLMSANRWAGGILVGVAAAVKLTPLVFILFFILKKDWRNTLSSLATVVVLHGAAFLVNPAASLQYWSATLFNPSRIGGLGYASNQSINGFLVRLSLQGRTLTFVWLAVGILIGLTLIWLAILQISRGQHLNAMLSLAMIALLCSPVSWSHQWVWAVVILITLLPRERGTIRQWLPVGSGVFIFGVGFLWLLPNGDNREYAWSWWQVILGNSYLLWAAFYIAFMFIHIHRTRLPATHGNCR